MQNKVLILFILVLLIFGVVFADIGPSPSYSFSISNASDYQEYSFFYSGNIWKDKLVPVTNNTSVYKFNTIIHIFAIKTDLVKEVSPGEIDKNSFADVLLESNEIKLDGGSTILKIDSLDEKNNTLNVSVANFSPDTSYPIKVLLFDPVGWIFLLIIIIFVVFGGYLLYKKVRK